METVDYQRTIEELNTKIQELRDRMQRGAALFERQRFQLERQGIRIRNLRAQVRGLEKKWTAYVVGYRRGIGDLQEIQIKRRPVEDPEMLRRIAEQEAQMKADAAQSGVVGTNPSQLGAPVKGGVA